MTWGFGKVILLGEHAVVYGHPAVAGSLARRVQCHGETSDAGLRLRVPAWDLDVSVDDDHPVAAALAAIADACPGPRPSITLVAKTDLPAGAGLGSSAALSVAIARALTYAMDIDDARLEQIAAAGERCFHENPSGVDVALATRGGLGLYRRGHGFTPIRSAPVSLVIGLSGQPRRTADMVSRVASQRDKNPTATNDHLTHLGDAAAAAVAWLESGDNARLGVAMTDAHEHLAALGVSTALLDELVADAVGAGALGAKLTGGGGGGAVIALAPHREADVLQAWHRRGIEAFTCLCGVTP